VLVIQVDVVGAEPLERSFDRRPNVRRAAVEHSGAATRVRVQTELGRQDDLLAPATDRSAHQLLIVEGAVDLGRVEMRDAQVERAVNGADRLGLAAGSDVVVAGHRHRAESDPGNVESADGDVLHGWRLLPFTG
jgi:hypothetical protein